MFYFLKLLYFCIGICVCNANYSATLGKARHDFINMSCADLMLGLSNESSFNKTYSDKNLALVFSFERNANIISIIFSHKVNGRENNGVYANYEIDLANQTLMSIDSSPETLVEINKDYIPFIADKCTPDQNVYINTATVPDPDEESDMVENKCGEYIFQIKILRQSGPDEKKFELYYKKSGKKKNYFIKRSLWAI